jgi:hypothetical protein
VVASLPVDGGVGIWNRLPEPSSPRYCVLPRALPLASSAGIFPLLGVLTALVPLPAPAPVLAPLGEASLGALLRLRPTSEDWPQDVLSVVKG